MNADRHSNNGDRPNDFALVRKPSSAVEKAAPGVKRIVAGMVEDALALAKKEQRAKYSVVLADDERRFTKVDLERWCQQGENYYFGRGVPQNYTEAVKLFRKAAEHGHPDGQCNLGAC